MDLGIHPRIRTSVTAHLAGGEELQAAFPAMAVHWALFALVIGAPLGFAIAFSGTNWALGLAAGAAVALIAWVALGAMRGGSVYRVVVATNRRIMVFSTEWWSSARANALVEEFPRSTPIGPFTGLWYRTDALGGPLWIHRRFAKDVATADRGVR